jgi:rod shape determining protein RodA
MNRRNSILDNMDWLMVTIYLVLVVLGWLNIYAAVYNDKHQNILDFTQRYGKQMIWIFFAIILAFMVFLIDVKFYSIFAYIIFGFSILMLMAVLVAGVKINGARSWFSIGGFLLQPSEFAKLATSLALAKFLSSYNLKLHQPKTLLTIGTIIFLPVLFILLQPDKGSAIVYLALFIVLYREGLSSFVFFSGISAAFLFFVSLVADKFPILLVLTGIAYIGYFIVAYRKRYGFEAIGILLLITGFFFLVKHLFSLSISYYYLVLASLVISSGIFLYYAIKKKIQYVTFIILFLFGAISFNYSVDYVFNRALDRHQRERIDIMLGKISDPKGKEYNINQSKIAIGSGGLAGKGFLQGTQTKFNFVPEQSTDFIFCTVGEEWGFIGSVTVILLFFGLLLRIIMLAERQRSVFSRVYGYCVASILFFHLMVNVGMTIGLLPVIGIPMPFFSYGGSSLWSFTVLLFIFIRLDASRYELLK